LMVGTGFGAKNGILVRDLDTIQNAAKVDVVVLDKTGTLTRGRPTVVCVKPGLDEQAEPISQNRLLSLAAAVERLSEHPLAKAIVEHARLNDVPIPQATDFFAIVGESATATVEGLRIRVGRPTIASTQAGAVEVADITTESSAKVLGVIVLDDSLKPDTPAAIASLRKLGVRLVMLTGDHRESAAAVALRLGIDEVIAGVKPGGKAEAISAMKLNDRGGKRIYVAMVGDGINDAPALAGADVGIAVGSGSDIAKETGGVVLVGSSLSGVATALVLSRVTMRKIRQNLFWAFFYNVCAIPLAAFGMLTPTVAAAAMAFSDVTVIGNALLIPRSVRAKLPQIAPGDDPH